jgi:hypothetical protein
MGRLRARLGSLRLRRRRGHTRRLGGRGGRRGRLVLAPHLAKSPNFMTLIQDHAHRFFSTILFRHPLRRCPHPRALPTGTRARLARLGRSMGCIYGPMHYGFLFVSPLYPLASPLLLAFRPRHVAFSATILRIDEQSAPTHFNLTRTDYPVILEYYSSVLSPTGACSPTWVTIESSSSSSSAAQGDTATGLAVRVTVVLQALKFDSKPAPCDSSLAVA